MKNDTVVQPAPLDPSVLIDYVQDPRRAITETGIICLVCGRSFRHLTNTHLGSHGLTSIEYKHHFGYNIRRALMVASVRRTHSENARKSGLADRIRSRPIIENIELRRMGGLRARSLEESLARRERCPLPSPYTGLRDSRGRFTTAHAPEGRAQTGTPKSPGSTERRRTS